MIMKIFLAFIDPLTISIVLLLATIFIFNKTNKKIYIYIFIALFYCLNTSIISESLLYYYERQFPKVDVNKIENNATIFVFGGGAYNDESLPISSRPQYATTIRLLEAIIISSNNSTLIFSGKDTFLQSSEAKSMDYIAKKLKPKIKIKLDESSTNSEQQIKYISKLKYKQIILVSSASHIPRINMLAKRYNIKNYILAPTEHKIKELHFEIFDFFPNAKASNYMRYLIYELAAYLYFSAK